MNRTFRYRLSPTRRQQTALTEMLVDHCTLYNAALQERRDAWKASKTSIGYAAQCKQLTAIRRADEQYARWSATSEQQTLRRLNVAFAAFYRRAKKGLGKRAGYPRFKSRYRFDTVTFVQGDGGTYRPDVARVHMQGVGEVKVRQHRPVRGRIKQFSVTRQGRHWYVNVMCENVPHQIRPATGAIVGVDKGTRHLLADSDGGFVPNPRHYAQAEDRLTKAQQDLSRTKRGSNRRRKAAARLAAHHRKVANTRRDFLHRLTRDLVDTYDIICHEKLKIPNMTAAPEPRPDPDNPGQFLPNGAAAKAALNKSILDAGWGGDRGHADIQSGRGWCGTRARRPPQHLPRVPRMRAHR